MIIRKNNNKKRIPSKWNPIIIVRVFLSLKDQDIIRTLSGNQRNSVQLTDLNDTAEKNFFI